ncbi:MAG TPA: insulinase family protein [Lacunisphaera sp.]
MKRYPGQILFAFLLVVVAVCGAETTPPVPVHAEVAPWPLEHVLLKQSPRVTEGRLENGLRYAIVAHASPPGRISMRLAVLAGSLDENDDERGYAHFVEHMAFSGTKHFPAGELVKFLERQGVAFGADVNAFTTHTHTLYQLELPENSPGTLKNGLLVFRDIADGMLFEPREVKRALGVILSEERSRHTPEETERLALIDFLYHGTRIPNRQPIGLISTVELANSAALRKFYKTWYRPENMCVIIVGQIDTSQVEAMVRNEFASLAATGPAPAIVPVENIEQASEPLVAISPRQQGGFHLSLVKVASRTEKPFTWGTQLEELRLQAAFDMLRRRLDGLTRIDHPIISGSDTSVVVEYGKFRKLSVVVASSITDWEKAMSVVEQEVRRVIEHGFAREELASYQASLRDEIQAMGHAVPTMPSTQFANMLVDSLEERTPVLFTDEALDESLAVCDRLTPEECQRVFREYWGKQPPHIFVETAADLMPSPEKIRAAYNESRNVAVDAPSPATAASFAYDDFGPAGEVMEKTYVKDLDLWQVRLSNGVRLNVKRTPFENALVRFSIHFGSGLRDEPADKPGLHTWVGAWLYGGLKKHSFQDLTRMAGGVETLNAEADEDVFSLSGSARTEHFSRALHESAAFFSEPGFRPEGHMEMASELNTAINPLWNTAEGAMQLFILPSITGNYPRIGLPNVEGLFARTSEELQAWLTPALANGAIEIAVVGDITVDTAIAEVAKTFGTLRSRQAKSTLTVQHGIKFPKQPVSAFSYYNGPLDRPSTLEFFWPVRALISPTDRWRLRMLALIISDRVREQVREKQGATYSPNVAFYASDSYPEFDYLRCTVEVKPEDAVHFGDVVRDLGGKLANKGVTVDELARAKAQYVVAAKGSQTDNNFWLTVLGDAQARPESLTAARSMEGDISNTSIADLNILARRWLGTDKVFRYIIEPSARKPKSVPAK